MCGMPYSVNRTVASYLLWLLLVLLLWPGAAIAAGVMVAARTAASRTARRRDTAAPGSGRGVSAFFRHRVCRFLPGARSGSADELRPGRADAYQHGLAEL